MNRSLITHCGHRIRLGDIGSLAMLDRTYFNNVSTLTHSGAAQDHRSGVSGNRLHRRLLATAKEWGARSAYIDFSSPSPALRGFDRQGRPFRVELTGPQGAWHRALD